MNTKAFITVILLQSIFQISILACFAYSQEKEIWGERATPLSQGIDEAKMIEALDYLKSKSFHDGIEEVVIVRNGKIIYEGDSVAKKHNIYSCSKVFTNILGNTMKDYLTEKITDPIGMGKWRWDTEQQTNGIAINNGCTGVKSVINYKDSTAHVRLETQDYRPPYDDELIYTHYRGDAKDDFHHSETIINSTCIN